MANKPAKALHLKDLFKNGELISLSIDNPDGSDTPLSVEIWMQKPSTTQYEEALTKARARQARKKRKILDPNTDEFEAYRDQLKQYDDRDAIVDALVRFEENRLRTQAYNLVLYAPVAEGEEPKWGKDGSHYTDLLAAIKSRYDELAKYNKELGDEDSSLRIDIETDEEMIRLNVELDTFTTEVNTHYEQLRVDEVKLNASVTMADLKQKLLDKFIDVDTGLEFYQEYKVYMLLYACRYPIEHHKLYFEDVDTIWSLPDWVRNHLFNKFDDIEESLDDVKNSLSLLSSSLS